MRGRVGGGSRRAPNSNCCWGGRGENWGRETAGGARRRWEEKREEESGRGVWKTEGTRQRLGEEAQRTVGDCRGVRGRTERFRAPTATAWGSYPSPPSARPPAGAMVDRGPLLTSAIIFYLSIGAAIFEVLEEPHWRSATDNYKRQKTELLKQYPCLGQEGLDKILQVQRAPPRPGSAGWRWQVLPGALERKIPRLWVDGREGCCRAGEPVGSPEKPDYSYILTKLGVWKLSFR